MILNTILNSIAWTPYGLVCPDAVTAKVIHKFMREAVMDRHICISKVIGFTIKSNNTIRSAGNASIARHKQIGESYPELMCHLLDKVFINVNTDTLDMLLSVGMNTLENNCFGNLREYSAEVLYTDAGVCRCLKNDAILRVWLQYDCGYRGMASNSKILNKEFYPCYTDYSLEEYVRVLPMMRDQTLVPIRYYNGMTEEIFKNILSKWLVHLSTSSLKKEEKLWLQNFTL